ncbi:MAG: hypothetical protein ACHQD9_03135 [Chitinophagales bacterium]
MQTHIVTKEQIPQQKLKREDVLATKEARKNREESLRRAAQFNRNAYSKARIIFDTIDATLEVVAHVWEITDKNVLLQGGITLPVSCIRDVSLEDAQSSQVSLSGNH